MNKVILLFLVFATNALADNDPAYCKEVANAAWNIANDRDNGTSYHAELGKIKGAAEDTEGGGKFLKVCMPILKTLYKDKSKETPDDALRNYFAQCLNGGK